MILGHRKSIRERDGMGEKKTKVEDEEEGDKKKAGVKTRIEQINFDIICNHGKSILLIVISYRIHHMSGASHVEGFIGTLKGNFW